MSVASASSRHPKPSPDFRPVHGTAGFRSDALLLDSTVFRCGLLIAARSVVLGRPCGLMVTASHNPEHDNGVKLVEPCGGMLVQQWEHIATQLACADSDQEVADLIARLLQHRDPSAPPQPDVAVVLGCDTRPSSPALRQAACEGVHALGVRTVQLGEVTTPQLHFQVAALNAGQLSLPREGQAGPQPVTSLDLYFSTMLSAFEELMQCSQHTGGQAALHVDCANGVGARHLLHAAATLAQGTAGLHLHLINAGGPGSQGLLNHSCGADFVQKECKPPAGFQGLPASTRCCSIDGDADRLIYFSLPLAGSPDPDRVSLLDGDRIAALIASFVSDALKGLPRDVASSAKVGVVQTAYANGASTRFITQGLGLSVVCTKTGVKHLHPAAHAFDIGIYFEANGHGTALFRPALLEQLKQLQHSNKAARQLLLLSQMINQTVGDAFSGILAVEAVLKLKQWSISDWQGMYSDLPSKQMKVLVKDRNAIKTGDAERLVVSPPELQGAINEQVTLAGEQARAFVRPSGTEDIVRVYAEAQTREAADALAKSVAQATHRLAGGVGPVP